MLQNLHWIMRPHDGETTCPLSTCLTLQRRSYARGSVLQRPVLHEPRRFVPQLEPRLAPPRGILFYGSRLEPKVPRQLVLAQISTQII